MAEMKISAVYKITNTVTGDSYIGSSKNVKHRWMEHKCQSTWNKYQNSPMYLDMKRYGTDKFELQILAEVEIDKMKELEQKFIETLKPTYNSNNANGLNIERKKEYNKEYLKEYMKEYEKTDKYKEYQKEFYKEYNSQPCCYNGETLTLCALRNLFSRAGNPHPQLEAKKYLVL